MPDNVEITAGSGTTIATDQIGTEHHQKVKLEFGVADSATLVSSSDPLPVVQTGALPAGDNNVGNVDVLTMPGTAGEAAALPALFVVVAGDDGTDTQPIQLSAGGDLKVTLDSEKVGADLDSDATPGSAVPATAQYVAGTDGTNARGLKTDTNGELQVDVLTVPSDPFGANADAASVTGSISAKLRTAVTPASTMNATSGDGSTALTSTAQAIKASAGVLLGYSIYNPNTAVSYVIFYNTAQGSVVVGTTAPLYIVPIPPGSLVDVWKGPQGIDFTTAMAWAATSTAGGNGAPTTALDATAFYR